MMLGHHGCEAEWARPVLGPGSLHRAPVPLWRQYYHPPFDDRGTTWIQARRTSKLNSDPPLEHGRNRGRTRPVDIRIVFGS